MTSELPNFPDAVKLERLDSNTFRAQLNKAFCIGLGTMLLSQTNYPRRIVLLTDAMQSPMAATPHHARSPLPASTSRSAANRTR